VADEIAHDRPVGALAGVPIAVKDLIATRGIRTAMGAPAYRDFVPDEDDVAVERIKAADAVILGKTTVPQFGYSGVGNSPISPTARNPWNPELTPGGSSAGSGIAVATGLAPVALGSEGGGSVRIPSAHCGLYGFKGSMGRIPLYPLYPGCRDERYPGVSRWESLEHLGPMTRTVADAALMMSVLAGPDPRDRHSLPPGDIDWLGAPDSDLGGLRIAFSADLGYLAVDPEVRAIATRAAAVFEKELRCVVEQADPGWPDPFDAFWGLVVADTDLTGMRAMVDEHGAEMSPHLIDLLTRPWTAEALTDAATMRRKVVNTMWRFILDYDTAADPHPCGAAVPGAHAGTRDDRRPDGARHIVARLHLPDQHDRPARGDRPRRVDHVVPARRAADRRAAPGRRRGAEGLGRLRTGRTVGRSVPQPRRLSGPVWLARRIDAWRRQGHRQPPAVIVVLPASTRAQPVTSGPANCS
jgi:aspartyl-tRNA(Asn)/glutamyl-tRNA(Gln) amidotransferase subunit A